MNETKEEINCIFKAFENNPITIIEKEDEKKKLYWFKANDIAK